MPVDNAELKHKRMHAYCWRYVSGDVCLFDEFSGEQNCKHIRIPRKFNWN